MKYRLTKHAEERAKEREISTWLIQDSLESPTDLSRDNEGKLLIKRLYKKKDKERLLLLVGKIVNNELLIITIIETSKVKKYL